MSAAKNAVLTLSFKAAADLSSKQYYLVKLASDTTVNVSGANERAIGVLLNKPESGEEAIVGVIGVFPVVAAEAIDRGTMLTSTAAGKAEEVDAAGEWTPAIALEAASADGDIIRALFGVFTKSPASDA